MKNYLLNSGVSLYKYNEEEDILEFAGCTTAYVTHLYDCDDDLYYTCYIKGKMGDDGNIVYASVHDCFEIDDDYWEYQ